MVLVQRATYKAEYNNFAWLKNDFTVDYKESQYIFYN